MTFNKSKIALGVATATITMAGAMVSPQAAAHSKAERVADATARKTEALEMQVQQMASMMEAMQAELSRVKASSADAASSNTAKVQELDQWMASVKNAPVPVTTKDHVFAVRGGWMQFDDNRGSNGGAVGSGYGEDLLTSPTDDDAFYYGGAIDFNLNNDLFGLMDDTSSIIELGIEYAELAEKKRNGLSNVVDVIAGGDGTGSAVPLNTQQSVTVNMLRISAATKIKFMHGSKFRPWIIPAGLDINIISPPSDAVTVLNTGMQFGAGAEYEIFDGIVVGADSRYHWTPDDVDGVDTDGFTVGGSVGFKF